MVSNAPSSKYRDPVSPIGTLKMSPTTLIDNLASPLLVQLCRTVVLVLREDESGRELPLRNRIETVKLVKQEMPLLVHRYHMRHHGYRLPPHIHIIFPTTNRSGVGHSLGYSCCITLSTEMHETSNEMCLCVQCLQSAWYPALPGPFLQKLRGTLNVLQKHVTGDVHYINCKSGSVHRYQGYPTELQPTWTMRKIMDMSLLVHRYHMRDSECLRLFEETSSSRGAPGDPRGD